jgi:xanthine dehydrogenase YagT iron-sulfur-binding subunit
VLGRAHLKRKAEAMEDKPQSLSENQDKGRLENDEIRDAGLPRFRPTRRSFLTQLGVAGITATAAPLLARTAAAPPPVEAPQEAPVSVPGAVPVVLNINGKDYRLKLDPRTTVLDAVRENLKMFGTKKGCDHGQCGACTVHINGRRVNSCLTFAVMHQGDTITTIEGLAQGGELHPVQQAFVECDGFQCGYCTPGQIMSGAALLKEPVGPADDDVREMMSGNLCRCGAYDNIVAAVQSARKKSSSQS